MEQSNLKVVEVGQVSQDGIPAAIEAESPIQMNGLALGPVPVPKGQRLDVDEILRRSLPKLSQPTVLGRVNKGTP